MSDDGVLMAMMTLYELQTSMIDTKHINVWVESRVESHTLIHSQWFVVMLCDGVERVRGAIS